MIKKTLALLLLLSAVLHSEPSYITFPSDIDWVTQESDHFQILYRNGQTAFALRALKAAEKAYRILTPIFPEAPSKTWIVLADFQDSTNGYALNFMYSHIVVFAAPPESTGQLPELDQWLESVILHEYVHILHLYPAHGLWKAMRTVFGSWVFPNSLMPSHFHEGMATQMETEFTKGGRGRSAHFAMYRRKAVERGTWGHSFSPLDIMDGTIRQYPHGALAYFWGVTMTQELWKRKGKKGIYDLTLSYSDNWPYFLNGPLEEVYQTDYAALWQDIFKKTTLETKAELEELRRKPLSKLEYLTATGYKKLDPTLSPDGTRVAFRLNSPYRDDGGIAIYNLKTRKIENDFIFDLSSADGMCWGKSGQLDTLYFLNHIKSDNYSIASIHSLVPSTGEIKKIGGAHIHQLDCSQDLTSFIYYEEVGGEGFVKESTQELKEKRRWKVPTGAWVTSLVAGDAAFFTVKKGIETSFYRWRSGSEPELLFVLNAYAFGLKKGQDPNELYAIVALNQVEEVWRFNVTHKTMSKAVAVTGGINGFTRAGNAFIVTSYEDRGELAGYDLALASPVVTDSIPIPTATVPPEDATPLRVSPPRSYSAFSTLFPSAWVPYLLFVPDGVQFAALIPWFDLSQKHIYSLYGGYDSRGQGFGSFNYDYRFARKYTLDIDAYYMPSYIRTETAFLKRWGGAVGISGTVPYFPPTIRLASLFRRQEESSLSVQTQSVGFEVDLTYSVGLKSRPLSISPEDGAKFSVAHSLFFKKLGSSHDYFSDLVRVDLYWRAPWWRNSVLYVGSNVGYTEGSPFYNSYFEGGGEILLSQGRGTFLNRGFSNGAFLGRRMFNGSAEYRFPIAWIERGSGLLPFRLDVIHAALVADVTSYDYGAGAYTSTGTKLPEDLMKVFYYSAGIELKTDWKFFFYIPTLLRVGAYHGFGGPYSQDLQFVLGMEASI